MADKVFWGDKWKEGHTPWDLGREHPGLHESLLLASDLGGLEKGARILVPGCGRGHEAYFLAHAASEWIETNSASPFFVRIDPWGPHPPYIVAEPFHGSVDPSHLQLPANFSSDLAGRPEHHAQ